MSDAAQPDHLAESPEPAADDTSGADNAPEIDAAAPEDTTVGEAFADAFAPPGAPDDSAPTAEDYDALAAEYEAEQEDSADEEPDTDDDADEEAEPASRREARYRTRLRDTEARLEAATDENISLLNRLEAMQWTEAVRLASTKLADPAADLFREYQLDDVLTDDGTVDPQRVNELADSIIASHPHYAAPRTPANPNALKSGARKPDQAPVPSWQRAFAPRPK